MDTYYVTFSFDAREMNHVVRNEYIQDVIANHNEEAQRLKLRPKQIQVLSCELVEGSNNKFKVEWAPLT